MLIIKGRARWEKYFWGAAGGFFCSGNRFQESVYPLITVCRNIVNRKIVSVSNYFQLLFLKHIIGQLFPEGTGQRDK